MRWSSLQVGLVAVGVSACGHLNDADYQGDPRYRVEGSILGLADTIAGGDSYVTVVWGLQGYGPGRPDGRADVDPIVFPAPFTLTLYDAPTVDDLPDLFDPDDPASGWYTLGHIMVFEDIDRDGQYTPDGPDRSRGDAAIHIVYAHGVDDGVRAHLQADPYPPFTNPEALVDGFQLAGFDLDAGRTLLPATAEVTIEPVLPPPADPL